MDHGEFSPMKLSLVLFNLLSNILFAGIIFGWASFQLILERDNVFREKCPPETPPNVPCDEQINLFSLVYTIGTTCCVFSGFFIGILLDRFGPSVCVLIGCILEVGGLLALGFSNDLGTLCFGSVLIAFGGVFAYFSSFLSSYIVPQKYHSLVVTSFSCTMDASSGVFLILYLILNNSTLTRKTVFISYAIIAAIVLFLLFLLWRQCEPDLDLAKQRLHQLPEEEEVVEEGKEADEVIERDVALVYDQNDEEKQQEINNFQTLNIDQSNDENQDEIRDLNEKTTTNNQSQLSSILIQSQEIQLEEKEGQHSELVCEIEMKSLQSSSSSSSSSTSSDVESGLGDEKEKEKEIESPKSPPPPLSSFSSISPPSPNNIPFSSIKTIQQFQQFPLLSQIFSPFNIYLTLYLVLHQFRANSYLGSVKNSLTEYGDAKHHYFYTQLFQAITPIGGVVFVPFVDLSLRKYGFLTTFHFITFLGVIYGSIVLIPYLPIQYLSFIIFACFRAFFYSAITCSVSHCFGPRSFGTIYGGMSFTAGGINLLQWPATILSLKYQNGHLQGFYLFLLSLCIPIFIMTEMWFRKLLNQIQGADIKEEQHKEIDNIMN